MPYDRRAMPVGTVTRLRTPLVGRRAHSGMRTDRRRDRINGLAGRNVSRTEHGSVWGLPRRRRRLPQAPTRHRPTPDDRATIVLSGTAPSTDGSGHRAWSHDRGSLT